MHTLIASHPIIVFAASVLLVLVSSAVLSTALERVGAWLRFSAGLLGLLTALGADSPEISSALTALQSGHHDLGLGVVFGSNLFNLAALLGLSAITAGGVRARAAGVTLNGTVGMVILGIGGLLLYGAIGGVLGASLLLAMLLPYAALMALPPERAERLTALPAAARRYLVAALSATPTDNAPASAEEASFEALALVPALAAIVVGSIGMVNGAVVMAGRWHIRETIVGAVVLAGLTGIPNAVAAQSLARKGRGATVLSEALNSNSFNIVAGVGLPAVVIGFGAATAFAVASWWWLVGATLLTLALLLRGGELRRSEGAVVVAAWAAFAAVTIIHPF